MTKEMRVQNSTLVKVPCVFCKTVHTIEVPKKGCIEYMIGEKHVQQCFPELSAELREMFISGVCPECFDKTFGDE